MTVTDPDPNAPPPQGDPPQPPDPNSITVPVTSPEPPAQPQRQQRSGEPPQVFSQEDIDRIRQEERARYTKEMERADGLDAELARFRQAEDERVKAEAKTQRDADRAAKKKEEEEMELRDLIAKKDAEWEAKLEEERQARQQALAVLEQERRHSSLQTYMAQRMAEVGDGITPELRDLVAGNSTEEIDSSIQLLIQKSDLIKSNVIDGFRQVNSARPTVGVTAPPVGPMETSQTTRTYTADELKAMTPEEYAAERDNLLRAAAQSRRQQ
jgi:hypothetical protein